MKAYVYIRACTNLFITGLCIIPTMERAKSFSWQEWLNNLWYILPWNTPQLWKGINYWHTEQFEWFSRESSWIKETYSEDYILYDCLYVIVRWWNYSNRDWLSGCQMLGDMWGGKRKIIMDKKELHERSL